MGRMLPYPAMRYAIDLDGVVAAFHEGFARAAGRIWPGRILPHVPPADKDYETLGLTEEEVQAVKQEIRMTPNFWLHLPAIRRNVEAIVYHRLEFPDDEIFYVTARYSDTTGMSIMAQSQQWTLNVGIGGLGTAVICSRNKVEVYEALEVDAAIDDDPRYLVGFPRGYLLTQPWNGAYHGRVQRIESVTAFFARAHLQASPPPLHIATS